MVNSDVDGYSKTPNPFGGKYSKKRKKNNNLAKTIRILKLKYKLGGGRVFTLSLPEVRFALL